MTREFKGPHWDKGGFTTDLPNGLTVSVQWHWGAYCSYNEDGKPKTVEMACWETGEEPCTWRTKNVWGGANDDVIGYLPVGDVVKFIDIALNWEN